MPKDSQPDNKQARKEKSKGQIPLTAEGQIRIRIGKNNPLNRGMFN